MEIEIWSDVVCPWCWIGETRLQRALEETGLADRVDVRIRAFQLDPQAERRPTLEHLRAKFGASPEQVQGMVARVAGLGEELGLPFDFERALSTSTADAHRLVQLANESGLGPRLLERLHRAHFAEGADVGDGPTLARLGAEVGLDPGDVERVLGSDAFAERVWADQEQARGYGIQGVPFFVLAGRHGLSGAQPQEVFAQVLREVAAEAS